MLWESLSAFFRVTFIIAPQEYFLRKKEHFLQGAIKVTKRSRKELTYESTYGFKNQTLRGKPRARLFVAEPTHYAINIY
jgi:hypothetical protein